MADIALISGASTTGFPELDIALTVIPEGATTVARDVEMDDGLSTAIYLSIFTDARADPEGARDPTDLRGWWGDEFGQLGSLLWQLTRGKATDEVVNFAQTSAEAALQWMVDSGIAASVSAEATRVGLYAISIVIQIQRPAAAKSTFRYALNWAAMS